MDKKLEIEFANKLFTLLREYDLDVEDSIRIIADSLIVLISSQYGDKYGASLADVINVEFEKIIHACYENE